MNQQQRDVIDYLQEENRVLREQLGPRRLRFTDAQRRRLAAKAKTLGRRVLKEIATIVTPDTLLAWHGTLIAKNTTGIHVGPGTTAHRGGDPRVSCGWRRRTAARGYTRIQGALANLDHAFSRGTSATFPRKRLRASMRVTRRRARTGIVSPVARVRSIRVRRSCTG